MSKDGMSPAPIRQLLATAPGAPLAGVLIRAATCTDVPLAARKYTPISVSIIAILVVAVHAALFGNYRSYSSIDNPWNLSFSYNYCIKGVETDVSFGGTLPFGMGGGTVVFGKLAAMVQCAALAPFNWSLVAANALSVTGVVLSMAAIFAFLAGQGFGRLEAATFCLALAVTEPFVMMGNLSRYEYITFFLAVCSLVLTARRHLFLAGFISVLAIEIHPIGIMAPVYVISYELSRMIETHRFRLEFNRITKMALGGLLGLAVYFILHPHILALLAAMSSNPGGWDVSSAHFLNGYFFQQKLYRHLPELAVFAGCLLVHVRRRDYIKWSFPLIASLATLFVGFIIRRGNYYYVPFWYFPSFLLVFLTISAAWRAVALPALVLFLFVPQYAVAYVWGHPYSYLKQGELRVARSAIASRGTDLTHAHIFGDYIFWPVFKDLSFEWAPAGKFNQPHGISYLICGLNQPFIREEQVCADELPAFRDMQLVDQFSWAGRKSLIYERGE
jgi:hypothetical protein